jgi:hypothetical protein
MSLSVNYRMPAMPILHCCVLRCSPIGDMFVDRPPHIALPRAEVHIAPNYIGEMAGQKVKACYEALQALQHMEIFSNKKNARL